MQYDAVTQFLGVDVLHHILALLDPLGWSHARFTCKFWYQTTKKISDSKPQLNVIVLGLDGSGKSTLCGNLLLQCGAVSDSMAQRMQVDAREYAWLLDQRVEKSTKPHRPPKPDNITTRLLEIQKHKILLIDSPGPLRYFKCIYSGVCKADVAVLLLKLEDFDVHNSPLRPAKEHVLLSYVLGVKHIIFALNRFGESSGQKDFDFFVPQMGNYAKKVGYKPEQLTFLPIDAQRAYNFLDPTWPEMDWFRGPTFLEALNKQAAPVRPSAKPLRVSVLNMFCVKGSGIVLEGRVETGVIKPNTTITVQPHNFNAEVKSIRLNHREVAEGRPSDTITFNVDMEEKYLKSFRSGSMVIGDPLNNPPRQTESFMAVIIVIAFPGLVKVGFQPLLISRTFRCSCRISEIVCKLNKKTMQTMEENPKSVRTGDTALFKLVPLSPICADTWTDMNSLAKFVIRENNKIIAVGLTRSVAFKGGGGN